MKYEDIMDEQTRSLVQRFYVYQSALITTPLGTIGLDNTPDYPVYFNKYRNELNILSNELYKIGIYVENARLPEEPTSFSPFSFLQDFKRQQALQFILIKNDEVIQPPEALYLMVTSFIERLNKPWQ
ncbi:hypothetical protein [Aeromonas salmonicida]